MTSLNIGGGCGLWDHRIMPTERPPKRRRRYGVLLDGIVVTQNNFMRCIGDLLPIAAEIKRKES